MIDGQERQQLVTPGVWDYLGEGLIPLSRLSQSEAGEHSESGWVRLNASLWMGGGKIGRH